jgi:hypothetical protein
MLQVLLGGHAEQDDVVLAAAGEVKPATHGQVSVGTVASTDCSGRR